MIEKLFTSLNSSKSHTENYVNCLNSKLLDSDFDYALFESKLAEVDWSSLDNEKSKVLKDVVICIANTYPAMGAGLLKSLLISLGLDSKNIMALLAANDDAENSSGTNSCRTDVIRYLMEKNQNAFRNFRDIMSSNEWNRFTSTDTLLAYFINFMLISELKFDIAKEKCLKYKYTIYQTILEVLTSLDCELNKKFIESKYNFMLLMRKRNITLNELFECKKTNLSESDVERLKIYEKLDFLFMYVLNHFDKLLTKNPERWEEFTHIFIKMFDSVLLTTTDTCVVQYFWFYFPCKNETLLKKFLNFLWKTVSDESAPSIKRNNYIAFFGSFLSKCNRVTEGCFKFYISKLQKLIFDFYSNFSDEDSQLFDYSSYRSISQYDAEYKKFKKHEIFYHLFFIFVNLVVEKSKIILKSNDQAKTNKFMEYVKSIEWERLVLSSLNPLYFCDHMVAENFVKLLDYLKIFDFNDIFCKNTKRLAMTFKKRVQPFSLFLDYSNELSSNKHLKYKFPFDRMLLPLTSDLINSFAYGNELSSPLSFE